MYYFIYETTNKLNGKKYRGAHVTKNINDGYLGSGVLLKKAIEKYGKESFDRVILKRFENKNDLYIAERNYVNRDWITSQKTYNLRLGGMGGSAPGRKFTKIHRERISRGKMGTPAKWTTDPVQKEKIGQKISESKSGKFTGNKKHLSNIQKHRKLVYNIETEKRYWVDKNKTISLPEIPSKIKKAIDLYNNNKKVSTTGIKKKEIVDICDRLNISFLLIKVED